MKKFFTLLALVYFAMPANLFGQYSVATLKGPWIVHSQGYSYVIFDGAGTILEVGSSMDSVYPAGTYTVAPNGAITAILYQTDGIVTVTGNLLSDTSETFYVDTTQGPYSKTIVTDTSALAGTWAGTVTDTNTGVAVAVQVVVNSGGVVTATTGVPLIAGKMFAENGIFTAYITTTDTNCNYRYMQMFGAFSGDSLNGQVYFGKEHLGNQCRDAGTVQLTKAITANQVINPAIDFSVYPQPFANQLLISLSHPASKVVMSMYDMCGRKVCDRQLGAEQNFNLSGFNDLTPGLYVLLINADGEMLTKRVLKN